MSALLCLRSLLKPINSTLVLLPFGLFLPSTALALPVPDATLGTQNTPIAPGAVQIDGGTTVGQNLFHSFDSFNIDTGEFVYFFSPGDVNNIFSRVTGSSPSEIDGVLGTFSDADLFLMNPNGVVFGENASLDVQGSFIVTTADIVELGPNGRFSALNNNLDKLLSVSPSAFLFSHEGTINGIASQARTARQSLVNPAFISTGLQVPNREKLILLGGETTINGGQLNALSGRIEIGAVSSAGKVDLVPEEYILTIPQNMSRADITIDNNSFLNVAAVGDGDVSLYANDLKILDSSLIISGIDSRTEPAIRPSGNIQIDVAGTMLLSDASLIGNIVIGSGIGGDVFISAGDINVVNGSQISTVGIGSSSIGDVTLQASDTISFSGRSSINSLPSSVLASTASFFGFVGQGDSGNIQLLAEEVNLRDGAFISSSVVSDINKFGDRDATGNSGSITIVIDDFVATEGSFISSSVLGTGKGGDIVINAQDRVVFDGININEKSSSGAFSLVPFGTEGTGGDIVISANTLEITNSAQLSSRTIGSGNAGNIIIEARDRIALNGPSDSNQFFVRSTIDSIVEGGARGNGGDIEVFANRIDMINGALLTASTSGEGDAGSVRVSAERIKIVGDDSRNSGIATTVTGMARGNSGDIEIYTNNLELNNNGVVNAATLGMGDAGNIIISANSSVSLSNSTISVESVSTSRAGDVFVMANRLLLDDGSLVSAESNVVDGGEINITLGTLLLLRNSSTISATAGNAQVGGDGGSLTIKTPFIVAIPLENSDITANAFAGSGGQVNITADGVFGIEPRPELTPLSDITASSALGVIGGSVTLNSPDTSFIQDNLTELPDTLVNPDTLVASSCVTRSQEVGGTFIISGSTAVNNSTSRIPTYTTGDVQIPLNTTARQSPYNSIAEPSGVYQTADGRLVMSRECSQQAERANTSSTSN